MRLDGKTNHDTNNADAGEHRTDINAENAHNGKNGSDNKSVADDAFKHLEIGAVLFIRKDAGILFLTTRNQM